MASSRANQCPAVSFDSLDDFTHFHIDSLRLSSDTDVPMGISCRVCHAHPRKEDVRTLE
jgi:hypothetical protein